MPKKKTDAQLDREINEALNAKKNLFIGTMATGISYADRSREKHGDYMTIARLPFSTLKLEWSPGRHSQAIRDLVDEHAAKIIAREGEEYPVSSSGQTITLGHGKRSVSHLDKIQIRGVPAAWAHRHFSEANSPSELAEIWRTMKNPWTGMGRYYATRSGVARSEIDSVHEQHRARLGDR